MLETQVELAHAKLATLTKKLEKRDSCSPMFHSGKSSSYKTASVRKAKEAPIIAGEMIQKKKTFAARKQSYFTSSTCSQRESLQSKQESPSQKLLINREKSMKLGGKRRNSVAV